MATGHRSPSIGHWTEDNGQSGPGGRRARGVRERERKWERETAIAGEPQEAKRGKFILLE